MNTNLTPRCFDLEKGSEYIFGSCQHVSDDFLYPPKPIVARVNHEEKSYVFQNYLFKNPIKSEINETIADIEQIEIKELLNEEIIIKQEKEFFYENRTEFSFTDQIPTQVKMEKIKAMLKLPDISKEAYDDLTFKCVELQNFKDEYLGLKETSAIDTGQEKPGDTNSNLLSGENIVDKIDKDAMHKTNCDSREDLQSHADTTETNTFKCNECNYEAAEKFTLTRPFLTHKTPNEAEFFKCDVCCFQTKYKSSIRVHLLRHKDNRLIKRTCDICSYETYYKNDLKSHVQQHRITEFSCDKCNFRTDKKNKLKRHYLRHKPTDEVEIFKCGQCSFYTRYRNSLRSHIRDHTKKIEVHGCSKCDYKTDKAFDIRLHLLVHENEQRC